MAGYAVWSRKVFGGLLVLFLLGCVIVTWRERVTLLSWFYIRNLARSTDATRSRWLGRVANLGEMALPGLFDCLARPEVPVCANARAALTAMTHTWGNGDPRTAELALRLAREFPHFSPAGQQQTLELAADWFREPTHAASDGLRSACSDLLSAAASSTEEQVQSSALELCSILLNPTGSDTSGQVAKPLDPAHKLVLTALQAGNVDNRLRAVRLSLYPGMTDLLEQVAGLLSDDSAPVRRATLIAVGPARDAVHDDQLLPCLHDADPEVRRLSEQALIARGLRPEYLELGRLLTDPQPARRVQVLDRLRESAELDKGLWLRRLSHDPSPSIRVAAVRAMSQQNFVDLSDRIDQIAREDGSPTVRQLAQFYLAHPRRGR